jgi:hypothetical protein
MGGIPDRCLVAGVISPCSDKVFVAGQTITADMTDIEMRIANERSASSMQVKIWAQKSERRF